MPPTPARLALINAVTNVVVLTYQSGLISYEIFALAGMTIHARVQTNYTELMFTGNNRRVELTLLHNAKQYLVIDMIQESIETILTDE